MELTQLQSDSTISTVRLIASNMLLLELLLCKPCKIM